MGERQRKMRMAVAALACIVALAAAGGLAARQIRSPAQIAAEAAPPEPSPITAPVERRALATEVIVRGTVRHGAPRDVILPLSALKPASPIVSKAPRPNARLGDGDVAMGVSGRPVFVFRGEEPMNRDLGPGSRGRDVRQLEGALARAGFSPGAIDGRYDAATAAAVAALYAANNETPFGPTDTQAADLRTAAQTAATARDALLQMRLALRKAASGAAPAEVNQARLDEVAAAEAVPTARLAITTAEDKADAAREAAGAARDAEAEAAGSGAKDVAAADADVVAKQAAVDAAAAAGDAAAVERANLVAAQIAARAARDAIAHAVARARRDGRRAAREMAVAAVEAREARATLAIAQRKVGLARRRVQILRAAPGTAGERAIVRAAEAEALRAAAELAKLAARTGVQVPADEILFFPRVPVRVGAVKAKPGGPATGTLMTVTNSRLAIDASLSVADTKLVRPGMRVRIEEPDLQVRIGGKVVRKASRPGTPPPDLAGTNVDPAHTYVEVLPERAPAALVGTSVKLSIAVKGTRGKVLAVPVGALSVAADGTSRVQVMRRRRARYVTVTPGLAAQGFVEIRGAVRAGDEVVIGAPRGR